MAGSVGGGGWPAGGSATPALRSNGSVAFIYKDMFFTYPINLYELNILLKILVDEVGLEEVPDVIQNYHLCIVKNRLIDSDIIAKASQMKVIMQYGVGIEGIDVNAATEHKIKVARINGSTTGNAVSCAEMAIYLTLGILRKQKMMDTAVKRKDLGSPVGDTIFGKRVLILGFGAIGVEIAKRIRPFGVKILATKRNWSAETLPCDIDELVDKKGGPEDMYEFTGEADIVITCLLLSNETGSYLVNIARGHILDYDAVFDHLKSGHLGGLGIDVAWTEPYDPEDPILKFSNVIITPHTAGVTEYSFRAAAKIVLTYS
uniref:Uncharacterized protein n=1 Tax=Oryza glaberrima TaxID=4538 RepID=I1Q9M0_ORYGL